MHFYLKFVLGSENVEAAFFKYADYLYVPGIPENLEMQN